MSAEPWEKMAETESKYYKQRMDFVASEGIVEQLWLALGDPRGVNMALRILEFQDENRVTSLLHPIAAFAASSHSQAGLARRVLRRVDPSRVRSELEPVVVELTRNADSDWEAYRRTAEMLESLGQIELLGQLTSAAAESFDSDIREVAEDFAIPSIPPRDPDRFI